MNRVGAEVGVSTSSVMARVEQPEPADWQREHATHIGELRGRLDEAKKYLSFDLVSLRREELAEEMSKPDLWDDPNRAREIAAEYSEANDLVELVSKLEGSLREVEELYQLAVDENDSSVVDDLSAQLARIGEELDSLELESLFHGEHDENDAVAEIHAGAGGTDAQDWALMLLRMYLRWAERRGFKVELDEVTPGQEAGILSATFIVHGRRAYGLLSTERGVHRLVRMSPFDAQHRRHTSFASLDVIPFLEDVSDEVEIDEKDLRIDTYRSSGAGGQHVNVTDSAVRITHLPTGIVVSCQNERSQHQNKAKALQILGAKLAERQREERKGQLQALSGPKVENAWGNQIRSYVLAPFQLVKDLRSQYETGNVEAVLDGDIDDFINSFLRFKRAQEAEGRS